MNKFLIAVFAVTLLSSTASADECFKKHFEWPELSQFCKAYILKHMYSEDLHGDMVEECTNLEKGLTRWGEKIEKPEKKEDKEMRKRVDNTT